VASEQEETGAQSLENEAHAQQKSVIPEKAESAQHDAGPLAWWDALGTGIEVIARQHI
jgi:hypothetical protein